MTGANTIGKRIDDRLTSKYEIKVCTGMFLFTTNDSKYHTNCSHENRIKILTNEATESHRHESLVVSRHCRADYFLDFET